MARSKLNDDDKKRAAKIGENLSNIIQARNMTKKDFSIKLEIPYSSTLDYLNGKTLMPVGLIQKASLILNVLKSDIDPTFKSENQSSEQTSIFKFMTREVPVYSNAKSSFSLNAEEQVSSISIPNKISRKKGLFGLKIHYDTMSKIVPVGSIAVIQKSSEIKEGRIGAIAIDNCDAKLYRYYKLRDGCLLEPNSYDDKNVPLIIKDDSEHSIEILGRLVWYCMDIEE